MLFNSPRGFTSGTLVAADVLMGITKPTNNKGITSAFSPWSGLEFGTIYVIPMLPVHAHLFD